MITSDDDELGAEFVKAPKRSVGHIHLVWKTSLLLEELSNLLPLNTN